MVEECRLSTPYRFKCGQSAKNRLVRAAMAEMYSPEGGEGSNPTEVHLEMYR